MLVRLPAGETVFSKGSRCDTVVLLGRGEVRITKEGETGRQIVLYRLRPGEACESTLLKFFLPQLPTLTRSHPTRGARGSGGRSSVAATACGGVGGDPTARRGEVDAIGMARSASREQQALAAPGPDAQIRPERHVPCARSFRRGCDP